MSDIYDLAILGGGPAGITAAIYASRARLNTIWIDKNFAPGGQITATYEVDNYPGMPGISGMDLGEAFGAHARKLGLEPQREKILSLENISGEIKTIRTKKHEYQAKALILAFGAEHRKLDIPGEDDLSGFGVSYCATCDGAFYKNKTAAVVGGGDTALGDALLLSRMAEKVYLIHRRNEFRGNAMLQEKVRNTENIEIILNAVPFEIIGDNRVNAMKIIREGKEEKIFTDGIFVAVGTVPNSGLLKGFVKLDKNGYIIADEDGVTSVSGFFAAGDVRTKSVRQVITAAADGASCVYSVSYTHLTLPTT